MGALVSPTPCASTIYATLLLGKGFNGKFVQELLGHATIAITLDTNSHALPGMANHATAMEDALS